MEDTQNSAPGSVPATKVNATRKGPDSQSVTKRYSSLEKTINASSAD